MTHKHTPAPWKTTRWGQTISIDSNETMGIAHINPQGNHNAGIPSEQDEANARLIAAAPELLEALKSIAENGGSTWDYATIGNVARRAVMLAEGDN